MSDSAWGIVSIARAMQDLGRPPQPASDDALDAGMPDSPERDEDAKPVPPPASPAWRTLWLGFDVVLGRAPSDAESAHWLTHFANGFMPWDLVAVLSGGNVDAGLFAELIREDRAPAAGNGPNGAS